MSKKVFCIGLDGVTFDLLMPWIRDGKLPNLEKLLRNGAWGNLESTIPYNSPVAWSSFITGKNPGKHGIFNFGYYGNDSYDTKLVNSLIRKGKSFWSILGEYGKRVGIINVPVTYPPEKVNGFLISGLMSPDVNEKICYPSGLYRELVSNIGNFSIKVYPRDFVRFNRFDELFDEMMRVIDKRHAIVNYLMESKPWDFFNIVFSTTDCVQHYFWRHMDPDHPFHQQSIAPKYRDCILRVHQRLDAIIGDLMGKLDNNTTVIIMSDHGMGANSDKTVSLNNWLAQEGFLFYKDATRNKINLKKRVVLFGKKYLSRKYKGKLKNFSWLTAKTHSIYRDMQVDWARTKAFSDDNRGTIWINLKGRHPCGIVEPGAEYENIREFIFEKLKKFTDPENGEMVFKHVLKREQIYKGECVNNAPDIILHQGDRKYAYIHQSSTAAEHTLAIKNLSMEAIKQKAIRDADHRQEGCLILNGPDIKKGNHLVGIKIVDIAPTILYLMGVPIPKDMDGRCIAEAIKEDYFTKNPPEFIEADKESLEDRPSGYTDQDLDDVKRILKGLGYLD